MTPRRAPVAATLAGALLPFVAACNNGSATLVEPPPTAPSAPGAPSVTVTSVTPSAGPAVLYTVTFSFDAGTACGQGLIVGGALLLDDGSVQDTADSNGFSGFAPFAADTNCTGSGVAAAVIPQRLPSLPGVIHVKAVTIYLSPPAAASGGTGGAVYPSLATAVATGRYATDLYVVAQPTSGGSTGRSVAGTWSGSLQDASAGAGSVRLTLSQSSTEVLGTWAFTFANAASNVNGSVLGSVFSSTPTLLLTPTGAPCPLVLTLNLDSAVTATTYAPASGCVSPSSGSITISKP